MKTRSDVITAALRRARIVAIGETPDADQIAHAVDAFDALTVEFQQNVPGDGFWVSIPEHVYAPMVRLLAADLAPVYGMDAPDSRSSALIDLMAMMRPDDREEEAEIEYY